MPLPARTWTPQTSTALALGLAHALTDAGCGFLVAYFVKAGDLDRASVLLLIVLYNTLAFGGQAPAGWLLDRLRAYRRGAVIGVVLVAEALVFFPGWALGAVVLAGVGNALFHVGAGALVLRSSSDRATEAGVFVGPGAAGLCLGLCLGAWRVPAGWPLAIGLLLAAPYLWLVARPLLTVRTDRDLPRITHPWAVPVLLCVACLLGSVAIRGLVGFTISGAWRGVSIEVLIALALAACAGKMLGGFVGDRLGWVGTSVVALALSAPLVSAAVGVAPAAVIGMLLFQLTMAITLKASHHVMPGRPGLAFGLPCLALWFGALPKVLRVMDWFTPWPVVLALVLLSAAVVTVGLRLLVAAGGSGGPLTASPRPPPR
jgi:MFS transporter, FSR family, fosmidomycin resistance protein